MPNVETKVLLVQIFGEKGHPMRKYQRILYWFPKFKHLNPFPVPQELPADPVDLARFSLTRIADDLDAEVTVYQVPSSYLASICFVILHLNVCFLSPKSFILVSCHGFCDWLPLLYKYLFFFNYSVILLQMENGKSLS